MDDRSPFGKTRDGEAVEVMTLRNAGGIEMKVITYGCTIVSLSTPDRDGRSGSIVLGFDRLEEYLAGSKYYGAVVGRYANRIAQAQFVIDGRVYHVSANEPPNQL